MKQLDIICAGEVMVEFCRRPDGLAWQQGFGGDTYNTAVYLARAGLHSGYMTWLGSDGFSAQLLQAMQDEGLNTDRVKQLPGRTMGLYTIDNDSSGERTFDYWRGQSPAREMFNALPPTVDCRYFYFSGITLAVIYQGGFSRFVDWLGVLKSKGISIVFDPNYRPRLWDSPGQTQSAYQTVLELCDIALPTFEDEASLWQLDTIDACRDFYAQFELAELIIKAPDLSCHAHCGGQQWVVSSTPVAAVDTTGAGDSFNAGYLAGRILGATVEDSIKAAQALSARVVQHRGAIIPKTDN